MSNLFSSMGIDSGIITIILMIITIVLIVLVMNMYNAVKKMNKRYRIFMKGSNGQSLEKEFGRKFTQIEKMSNIQDSQESEMKFIEAVQNRSLIKYGVVKYDAFEDVGGKLSFVLAMLDNNDTGIVLNAIHSKENCFLYIKEVVKGESYIMLSDEEIQALRIAKKFGDDSDTQSI
ncbi:MAG TPA: DUF4446 family protein [Lachnospiraceae bacterium]|nr:DUF4446 family protein [Lachnospiraceae bacterium]